MICNKNVFFTSDTHFNHENIVRYCNRPFSDVDDMNASLIENWNQQVGPNDIVYHLGDVGFGNSLALREILESLNGKIFLITGNHDKPAWRCKDRFEWVQPYHDFNLGKYDYSLNNFNIVLSHYPIEIWDGRHNGWLHFHGHIHSGYKKTRVNRIDVGVDSWDYKPVHVDELLREIASGDVYLPELSSKKPPIPEF